MEKISNEVLLKRARDDASKFSPTKAREYTVVTDIGMRMLYTEEANESGKLIKCYQALLLQDNYNIKNCYQTTQCKSLTTFAFYFISI